MRQQYESQQLRKQQALAEQAEPREARPSGAIRIVTEADVPDAHDHTLRLGSPISRPNAPVPVTPSIVLDASYLQAVLSVVGQVRARRRRATLAVVGAFLCGALAVPITVQVVRRMAAPVTAPVAATSVANNVGVAMRTPLVLSSAAPDSEPPHRTRMDQRDAAKRVHHAQELRRAGRMRDAWRLLTNVLKDRSGYPPALAAMAELELDRGRTGVAVRWARLSVRALPSSVENWELLGRACTVAGLHAESARAHARATELYDLQQ